MNRNLILGAAVLALVAVVVLIESATRRKNTAPAQPGSPQWKLVFNLPKTNSTLPLTNTPSKAN